ICKYKMTIFSSSVYLGRYPEFLPRPLEVSDNPSYVVSSSSSILRQVKAGASLRLLGEDVIVNSSGCMPHRVMFTGFQSVELFDALLVKWWEPSPWAAPAHALCAAGCRPDDRIGVI